MRHQALSPPMQALYRVFVLPSLSQTETTTTRSLQQRISNATTKRTTTITTTACRATPMQTSAFSTSTRRPATRPPEKRSQLWDEEIPAFRVAVVDPTTQKLHPPETLRYVLSRFDRKTHRLVCMTAPPSAAKREADGGGEWIPTCRIVSKKEQYEQEKAKQKSKVQAKKNSADNVKTIELNWAIDGNDLGHRMRRVEEFLREGRRVEVVLAKRKGGRKATIEECEGVVDKILETVEAVEGAKQLKKMEGKLAGVATLFLEGPKKMVEKEKAGKQAQEQQQEQSSVKKETQAEA